MKVTIGQLFWVALGVLGACSRPGAPTPGGQSDIDYYTCTMHPSVHSHDPDGSCPICGMHLVPVLKSDAARHAEAAPSGPHPFFVAPERQQFIGVTYATVRRQPLRRTVRAVGHVAPVSTRHWDYVARVDGYIHDLKVTSPGEQVRAGQVLMDLYSPDLVATEQEFIDLIRMRQEGRARGETGAVENADRLLTGARARLSQWNISGAEIAALETAREAPQLLPLKSPFAGIVEEIPVHQGRHVSVGDHLVDLVDLSAVWIWAEFYQNELPLVRPGTPVEVRRPDEAGPPVAGAIAVVDPFVQEGTRTGRVRIDLANPDGRFRPGAYVDVSLEVSGGEGLAVPVPAVLPTGERQLVFVDRGAGRLEPRFIRLGGQFGGVFAVLGGLSEGERVVASANFLIDAESKVQGALKDW